MRDILLRCILLMRFQQKVQGAYTLVWHNFKRDVWGDCSWISHRDLHILEEHSHSPLLVYSAVYHLRGIAQCYFQVLYVFSHIHGSWATVRWFWRIHCERWITWLSPWGVLSFMMTIGGGSGLISWNRKWSCMYLLGLEILVYLYLTNIVVECV